MWQLAPGKHPFEVVDGPLAGRRYCKGQIYTEIPDNMADWFAPVVVESTAPEMIESLTSQEASDAEQ